MNGELPTELWLELDPDPPLTLDGWSLSKRSYTHRYVLAPEGSVVLDPDMARVFNDWLHAQSPDGAIEVTLDFRAARGGAA